MGDRVLQPPRVRDPRVRAYPFPYKAWLALSSDPDNTLIADWRELDRVIWKELGLPFADTLFLRSYNKNLPQQVNLHDHPEIYQAHPHDTIHTWGDYVWAGQKGFDRSDAEGALNELKLIGSTPRVWVDHSSFTGNMLHNHQAGALPTIRDASGHVYPNPWYTLDLAKAAGVRYVWDGTITPILGQDRSLSLWSEHRHRTSSLRRAVPSFMKHRVGGALGVGQAFRDQFKGNAAYRPHDFPDGSRLYTFPRHGEWADADIDGLGRQLSPDRVDLLIANGGVSIQYTHLGKRPVGRMSDVQHIPPATSSGLEHVRNRWKAGDLQLSSVSRVLDYLVLRDHVVIDTAAKKITFQADGIAFDRVGAQHLTGHSFTFQNVGFVPSQDSIIGSQGTLVPRIEEHTERLFTLHFDR